MSDSNIEVQELPGDAEKTADLKWTLEAARLKQEIERERRASRKRALEAQRARHEEKRVPRESKYTRVFWRSVALILEKGINGEDAYKLAERQIEAEDAAVAVDPELPGVAGAV